LEKFPFVIGVGPVGQDFAAFASAPVPSVWHAPQKRALLIWMINMSR
jgi:hypothetical protein